MSIPKSGERSVNLPVTPAIPPAVQVGDTITSSHENSVRQALADLWTDLQALNAGSLSDPTTTKGDLLVRGAAALARLAVASDGNVLLADAASPQGVKWGLLNASSVGAVPPTRKVTAGQGMTGGGDLSADRVFNADVISVFGRTGMVVMTPADIVAGGGVPNTRLVSAGVGLAGGGDLSADRTLAVVADTTVQRNRISYNGTLTGTRQEINFIPGANVNISVADNSANNRVDVTISATGGGTGGSQTPWTSDIDGGNHFLQNTAGISIGGSGATPANPFKIVSGSTRHLDAVL